VLETYTRLGKDAGSCFGRPPPERTEYEFDAKYVAGVKALLYPKGRYCQITISYSI